MDIKSILIEVEQEEQMENDGKPPDPRGLNCAITFNKLLNFVGGIYHIIWDISRYFIQASVNYKFVFATENRLVFCK